MVPATQPSQQAVHSPHWRAGAETTGITAPQHVLYFRPRPQGHGSLRPTGMERRFELFDRPKYTRDIFWNRVLRRGTSRRMVYLAVLLSVLQGISMRGSKMVVSLSALGLGATPFQVGLLAATFAVFPLLLAVYAGKVSDRVGVAKPIFGGAIMMGIGMAVPLALGGLAGLLLCSALIGLGHIFFH